MAFAHSLVKALRQILHRRQRLQRRREAAKAGTGREAGESAKKEANAKCVIPGMSLSNELRFCAIAEASSSLDVQGSE